MHVFAAKLLLAGALAAASTTLATVHAVVYGLTSQDVLVGAGGGGALLYLAFKVFQDESTARRERRLHQEELDFERRRHQQELALARSLAWQQGRDGSPLEPLPPIPEEP